MSENGEKISINSEFLKFINSEITQRNKNNAIIESAEQIALFIQAMEKNGMSEDTAIKLLVALSQTKNGKINDEETYL